MKRNFALFLVILFFINYSCGDSSKTENNNLVITDKIMYDVPVVNDQIGDRTKNNPDWFWNNLPTPEGDNFVKSLIEGAISGKFKTYYYDFFGTYDSFDPIPENKLKDFMDKSLTHEYKFVDTTKIPSEIVTYTMKLDYTNVKALRFLEQWNLENGSFCKKVIAVAPIFHVQNEALPFVYFWILTIPEDEIELNLQ